MQLVRRTLAVLRSLGADGPQQMQQLATVLDLPLPSLHRLLATLSDEEFVVRLDDRRYALGPAALALARGARPLAEVVRPYLRSVAAETGETVFLTQLVGRRAVCTDIAEGSRALRLTVSPGQSMPLHAAASARAILAHQPDDVVEDLLGDHPLPRFTARTPVTRDAIAEHLRQTRERGFDVCLDELDPNVLAVSAPIRDASGSVVASLTVASPADRHEGAEKSWGVRLVEATDAISRELGATD